MTKELVLGESLTQDLSALVESYSERDPATKQGICQLLATDPPKFVAAAMQVLASGQPSPGLRFIAQLLAKEKLLPASLLDVRALQLEEAVAILRGVSASGMNLQPLLELALNRALQDQPNPDNSARILRLLGLISAVAAASTWNSFQLELMAYPDRFVRSRAALLIGRSTKNVAWIGRRFLDRDARVQASAVEALWAVDAAESRPLLLTAAKSKHNRVAANAALGLYRISDLKAIPILLDMARQEDENFRISAYWAIGETKDPRFLPFLMEQFKALQGRVKLAVTRALACIRRQEKAAALTGEIGIRVSHARLGPEGARTIGLALGASHASDFSSMKATDFALWESGVLIEDYEVKLPANPAALVTGFVVPRFPSPEDPYGRALTAALARVLESKRPDDPWRIDRYLIEPPVDSEDAPRESSLPYEDAFLSQEVKARYCFLAAAETLGQIVASEIPVERCAPDSFRALERQCAAIRKLSGKRHVFLFLHHDSLKSLEDEAHLRAVKEMVTQERIILHGFAPGPSHDCAPFRALCLSLPEATFSDAAPDGLAAAIQEIFGSLRNGCEVQYRLPEGGEPGPVLLKISSQLGSGQADITLQSSSG